VNPCLLDCADTAAVFDVRGIPVLVYESDALLEVLAILKVTRFLKNGC
jgi:hypothetical protein